METDSKNARPFLSGWKLILLIYLLLLGSSHLVRMLFPVVSAIDPDKQIVQVAQIKKDTLSSSQIDLAYYDLYSGNEQAPATIVFLHGSPQGNSLYKELLIRVSSSYRVIAPDYIGFEASEKNVDDYSVESQAVYIKQLIDHLGINKVHVVGYSLGGGVALELYEEFDGEYASLTMLAAIGVQELELLGGYHLNHAIHGAQLTGLWLLHEWVPHFGYLDDVILNTRYAHSFYDTDQRPLRGILEEFTPPMLIIHGEEDPQVPYGAALEHNRIVPQSELIIYPGAHTFFTSVFDDVANDITQFVESVEKGEQSDRSMASENRIAESVKPFAGNQGSKLSGLALIIVMVLIILATLVSEDLTCIGAGLMVARGIIGHFPAILACLIGIFVGDILLYLLGKWLGRSAIRRKPFKWFVNEHDLDRSYQWFEVKGPSIIIASRFIPGTRFPTYFTAGAIGASFWMFIMYFGIASIIWTPILVELAVLVGQELISYFELYKEYAVWVLLGVLVGFMFFFKVILPSFTYKGRRLLYSRYKRIVHWEFWHITALYFPVAIYVIFLWIKHRSLSVFSAVNPAIEGGGFVGESKKAILDGIEKKDLVARYEFFDGDLPAKEKLAVVEQFMSEYGLDFPIVIKPNQGERGSGVQIIRDRECLEREIELIEVDSLVQEYIEGDEFGIFYYRYPDQDMGTIFSTTRKELLYLEGDGKSTLEHLILKDARAVCMAKHHINNNSEHLFDIPEQGERIKLVQLGTHSKGAVFYDGKEFETDALLKSIDELSKSFDGFYFGRYDIRVKSTEELKKGQGFKVLELNGVTSEPTHIYNPGYSVLNAWRTLCEQWRIAFEIGAMNARRGVKYPGPGALINMLIKARNL